MIFIIPVIITIMSFIGCICAKKPAIGTLFVIVGVFCGLMNTLIGNFTYATKYRKNPVDSSVSPDGKYELLFQQIGDPEWPFGATHARLVLRDESGIITKYPFYVLNDGYGVHQDSWHIEMVVLLTKAQN